MDVTEAISGRRSVREYTTLAVDEKTIHLNVAAIRAPNAVNQQPWSFTVVRDQGALDRVSRAAKSHMLAALPATTHSDHFQSLVSNPDFQIFYHAPALILIFATVQGPWIVEDCALAVENLMPAARLRAWHMLDRVRPGLSQYIRREESACPPECLRVGESVHWQDVGLRLGGLRSGHH
jgi:nitroreductase